MSTCDLMLTPVVDPEHALWSLDASTDRFNGYKAKAWKEYWERAWCRLEALLAAVTPVQDNTARSKLFNTGALQSACQSGRRPHFVFGTKELDEQKPARGFPSLLNSFFESHSPDKGHLTDENDRELIARLTGNARLNVVDVVEKYTGEFNKSGLRHGYGRQTFADGSEYAGEFRG